MVGTPTKALLHRLPALAMRLVVVSHSLAAEGGVTWHTIRRTIG